MPILSSLDPARLRRIAGALAGRRGEYADLFLERSWHAVLEREGGIESPAKLGMSEGAAARLLTPEGARHASVGSLDPEAVDALPARVGGFGGPCRSFERGDSLFRRSGGDRWSLVTETGSLVRHLEEVEAATLQAAAGDGLVRMRAELSVRSVVVATSEGDVSEDRRSWVAFSARLTGEVAPKSSDGIFVSEGGGAVDVRRLRGLHPPFQVAQRLATSLVERYQAVPPPSGEVAVILGPGIGGILFHEACGHALEGDRALKGRSALVDLVGEQVGPSDLTLVDDPAIVGLAGSQRVDDEGWPATRNTLIDSGRPVGLLLDRATALLAGTRPTGSARRESYRDLPMPRMTNTFVLEGRYPPEEVLASVSRGVYVADLGSGEVDTVTGDFSFRARRAYLVASGRKVAPLRPLVVAGNGIAMLRGIRMIGNDLRFDAGSGECGKDGQRARASVGQPTIRVDSLAVRPEEGW